MSKPVQGPNLDRLAVIDEEGHRLHVHPADVHGRFSRLKPVVYSVLILVYALLPWIDIGGHPAVLIDIPQRRFYLFGSVFNAQDFYLAFYLLTGIGFGLILVSALFGRLWCGWACPQTVFLEAVFRRVERWIDGPRAQRIALAKAPWTAEKIARRVAKHALYLVLALVVSNLFLSYFVSMPELTEMMRHNPAEHWVAFSWMAVITGLLYFNFSWFREQLCLIICPYGRLQSALQDYDTLIIGYDEKRGEPRGKAKDENAGDCVDCKRCVVVCPTGIDIRNGLQMECVGCANCIDACDEVMVKLGRPTGLVRYDSRRGLDGGRRRFLRPRVYYYAVAGLVGLSVASFMFFVKHTNFEANVLRLQGAPFVVDEGQVRNQLMVHVINKASERTVFQLLPVHEEHVRIILPQPEVTLDSFGSHQVPVVVQVPLEHFKKGMKVGVRVHDRFSGEERVVSSEILGPSNGMGVPRPSPPPAAAGADGPGATAAPAPAPPTTTEVAP